jgi:hypothetical protein
MRTRVSLGRAGPISAAAGAIALLLAVVACQRTAERSATPAPSSPALVQSPVPVGTDSLTPRQACVIAEFERNDLPGRACMIQCIKDGSGYDIGGGCWHLCYAYTGVPMPRPERFDHCPDAGPEPVSPSPIVSCEAADARRELRVRFVDAVTGAPLAAGMILEPRSPSGIHVADSLGMSIVPVGDDSRIRLIGRARGYAYVMDSITVPTNTVCNVLLRLVSARGHGF